MTDVYDAVERAVEANFEAHQVPWMRRLVEQPSHTLAKDDVEAAARMLDETAASLGLSTRRVPDPGGEYADHRVFATPAAGEADRTPALVGHVDTVFPRSLGFVDYRRDDGPEGPGTGDVIRGPGVLDMKSGLSAMFFALRGLKEAAPALFEGLRLRVIVVSDEEVGSPSSEALFAELAPRLSEALVFEAGRDEDRVVTARKGGGQLAVCSAYVTGPSRVCVNRQPQPARDVGVSGRALWPFLKPIVCPGQQRRVNAVEGLVNGHGAHVGPQGRGRLARVVKISRYSGDDVTVRLSQVEHA